MDFKYKMMIVTREGLDLSPGKLAAQVAHAAVACALETKKSKERHIAFIYPHIASHTHVSICLCPTRL